MNQYKMVTNEKNRIVTTYELCSQDTKYYECCDDGRFKFKNDFKDVLKWVVNGVYNGLIWCMGIRNR